MVCIDNRGSLHRGAAWEAWLRGRLGQVELTDQVWTNTSLVDFDTTSAPVILEFLNITDMIQHEDYQNLIKD